jgi:hypothetical protein
MLEPVSKSSLAKYVLAEMPDGALPGDGGDWRADAPTITRDPATQQPIDVGPGAFVAIVVLSKHLVTLDRTDLAADGKAGPPFEMPYTLLLPVKPVSRWRMQQDLLDDSTLLKQRLTEMMADPGHILDSLSDDTSRRTTTDGFIASP